MPSPAASKAAGDAPSLQCDYLILGAGPCGMAFADALLASCKSKGKQGDLGTAQLPSIIIADDRDRPGGHWNDAPKFSKLQEDSCHYGVGSRRLERVGGKEQTPHRATAIEILTYYDMVMEGFLATGAVRYLPMTYGNGVTSNGITTQLESVMNPDKKWNVTVKKKVVHAGPFDVQGLALQGTPFEVYEGALVVPPTHLSSRLTPNHAFVVIGAGRVGIDVVLWLLSLGTDPSKIHWVMPREALLMRSEAMRGDSAALSCVAYSNNYLMAKTIEDKLQMDKAKGLYCQIDDSRPMECFHLTRVTNEELQQLRRITKIIRMGYVVSIHKDYIRLEHGSYGTVNNTLHIDCTSSWIKSMPEAERIFKTGHIWLQPVAEMAAGPGSLSSCQSAALIGTLESLIPKDYEKNKLLTGVRLPDTYGDWLRANVIFSKNQHVWNDRRINSWLYVNRLSVFARSDLSPLRQLDPKLKQALLDKVVLELEKASRRKIETDEASSRKIEWYTGRYTSDLHDESEDSSTSTVAGGAEVCSDSGERD